jgi:hypothetical protein
VFDPLKRHFLHFLTEARLFRVCIVTNKFRAAQRMNIASSILFNFSLAQSSPLFACLWVFTLGRNLMSKAETRSHGAAEEI